MKHNFIFFCLLFLTASSSAQQRPQYTQYVSNYFLINPAAAGMEKDLIIVAGYRKQWVGLNGSPSTSYLTLNKALGNEKNKPFHAVGLTVINDEVGALHRFVSYASYAYHVPLGSEINLSAGISAGISSINVNEFKLELENPVDPAVYNYTGKTKADINAGICFYGQKFFAGISLQQIAPGKVETNGRRLNLYGDRKFPDLFLSGGYNINMSSELTFSPSVMLKYINTLPVTFDLNAKMDYKKLFWAGCSYRHNSGLAGLAGIKIKDAIRFGYSYDLTTSGLQRVSDGTHEFLLSFTIKKK